MMKASVAFIFFMLFLAGLAFVNLRGMQDQADSVVTSELELISSAWRPARLGEMRLTDDTEMYLQFGADGKVTGHGGCNRFFGDYELTGEALKIGPLGATRMACPEPAMSFEISFLEAIQTAVAAASTADHLALKNDKGDIVVRLVGIERKEEN